MDQTDKILIAFEHLAAAGKEAHRNKIIIWSTLAAFYFICGVFMIVWQNKLISNIFLAKFCALLLANLLSLGEEFIPKCVTVDWCKTYISGLAVVRLSRNCALVTEQLLAFILFHEIYLVVCKMERRKYSNRSLFKKIGLSILVGLVYGNIFEAVFQFEDFYVSKNSFIDDICLSSIILILLLICFVKVMIALIHNQEIEKRTFARNNLIIHMMIVLLITQISKIIAFACQMRFWNESNLTIGSSPNSELVDEFRKVVFIRIFSTTPICSLAESLYILFVMLLKKTTCLPFCLNRASVSDQNIQ